VKENNSNGNGGKPPTEAQLRFAESLGIDSPEKYSRKELSLKISETTN
jgi:hypothetical protein